MYKLKVYCNNCKGFEEMEFNKGELIVDQNCKFCGCMTLSVFAKSKPLHRIQLKLLELSKSMDLSKFTLREMAKAIDEKESPQLIKHHLQQIKRKGLC